MINCKMNNEYCFITVKFNVHILCATYAQDKIVCFKMFILNSSLASHEPTVDQ